MKNKAWLYAVVIALLLCPVAASARSDTPPGRWWHLPKISDNLGLSQAEKDALDTLYVQSRRALMETKNELEKERFELDTMLDKKDTKDRAAIEQFKKVDRSRGKLSMERFRYLLEVRKILGYERYQKLMTSAREYHDRKGRDRGARDALPPIE